MGAGRPGDVIKSRGRRPLDAQLTLTAGLVTVGGAAAATAAAAAAPAATAVAVQPYVGALRWPVGRGDGFAAQREALGGDGTTGWLLTDRRR